MCVGVGVMCMLCAAVVCVYAAGAVFLFVCVRLSGCQSVCICIVYACVCVCLCLVSYSSLFVVCCVSAGRQAGRGGEAWRGGSLGKAKALRALVYGLEQTATQLIIRLVHGQIQLIEAVRERKGGE